MIARLKSVYRYYKDPLSNGFLWIFKRTELFNYYYSLSELNLFYLKHFIAEFFEVSYSSVNVYANEFLSNRSLTEHLAQMLKAEKSTRDSEPVFGRRIAWYIIARIRKPKVILESGIYQGVGSLVLLEALKINESEGFPGKYYGIDIDPKSGSFLNGFADDRAKLLFGDSIEMISEIDELIDLYINDGDHNPEYEYREIKALQQHLSPKAVLIADNAHVSPALADWSLENGMAFQFFSEKPNKHWYPGGGIGLAKNRISKPD